MVLSRWLRRTLRSLAPLLLAAVLPGLVGCGDGEPIGPSDDEPISVDRIEVSPERDTLPALGEDRSLSATALDAEGNEVSGVEFDWSSSDEAVVSVDDQGTATAEANGTAAIQASAGGVTGSAELAVIQQVESVSVSPSSATLTTVGATEEFSAEATDANDNPVSDVNLVWASENHAVATVDRTGRVTARGSGEATITATAQDVPGHGALTVDQSIDHLSFRTEPTDATAGQALDPALQVAVLDAGGNVVEDTDASVTLAIGTNPADGTLGGATTVPAVNGVATFSNHSIDAAATGYTLEASVGDASVTSQSFDISAAEAHQLAFATGPSDATAGQAINPAVEVEVQDEFGNPVTSSSATISMTFGSNAGGAALKGETTASASSGVAVFDDLNVEIAESGYTLAASSSGLGSETSGTFQIAPAAASQLAFVTGPSSIEGQEPISPALEVEVQDDFGNLLTSSTASITVSLADDPTDGEASLSGTATLSAANGVAEFEDLSVARPGDGFTVEATASDVTAAASGAFDVSLTFVQTSAGRHHTCGVTVTDRAYCWGSNSAGQLGDGTAANRSTPVPVAGSHLFADVRAGGRHTCGVTTADELFCWGGNSFGELGDGTTTDRPTPVAVDVSGLATATVAEVNAGEDHTCGVTTADEPFCWGVNSLGQLGDGTTTDRLTPVAVDVSGLSTGTFAEVRVGAVHTCGVTTADEPFCWGANPAGQLGDGTTFGSSTPVAVDVSGLSTATFAEVSAGANHTCGVTTADEPFCWGNNSNGQLGDGTTTDRETPVAVDVSGLATATFAVVSAGEGHTCGVTTADEASCWGANGDGRLGDGTTTERHTPVAVDVSGLSTGTFAEARAGGLHSCGLTTGDEAFCWGNNSNGQLGDGTTTERLVPARVVQ